MKKIYFIRLNKNKSGGAEIYLSRLSKVLEARKIPHEIIHSNLPKYLPSWLRVICFNLYLCIAKKNRFYFSLERITCPDVYRAGDGVHKVFLKTCRKSSFNPLHKVYLYIEKRCFEHARLIIANSKMVKRQIMETYDIAGEKIKVVYNGVILDKVDKHCAFEKLDKEFSISGKRIILYVGSGFERKGVKEFLQLIAKLKSFNIKAFVVGKDKNIKRYQELAVEFGIQQQVVFTGPRQDVNLFYAVCDIFILPTSYEPFSNVVLEAMAQESVVFTTRQNGASEILESDFIMNSPDDFSVLIKIIYYLNNIT